MIVITFYLIPYIVGSGVGFCRDGCGISSCRGGGCIRSDSILHLTTCRFTCNVHKWLFCSVVLTIICGDVSRSRSMFLHCYNCLASIYRVVRPSCHLIVYRHSSRIYDCWAFIKIIRIFCSSVFDFCSAFRITHLYFDAVLFAVVGNGHIVSLDSHGLFNNLPVCRCNIREVA